MAFDDDPRDFDYFDKLHKKPECSYWGDGEHVFGSNDTPDYRYQNHPTITLRCKCGATKEAFD